MKKAKIIRNVLTVIAIVFMSAVLCGAGCDNIAGSSDSGSGSKGDPIISDPYEITEEGNFYRSRGYVDLGLGVMWATCNVGTTRQEAYGSYYAWGEIEPQSNNTYTNESYKFYRSVTRDKYDSNPPYIYVKYNTYNHVVGTDYQSYRDGLEVLQETDDVAHVKWGGKWRMPTLDELTDLFNSDKIDSKTIEKNGIRGVEFTNKTTGNSIFLPAAGYYDNGQIRSEVDRIAYWSKELDKSDLTYARAVLRNYNDSTKSYEYNSLRYRRYYGLSVRPVFDPNS